MQTAYPLYDFIIEKSRSEFDTAKAIRETERGSVLLLRHRKSGRPYILRSYQGSGEVYRKLISVKCPNLPLVYDAAEKDGQTIVLEEYIPGDTLFEMLQGGFFNVSETKKTVEELCNALWVLHGLDVVHRDIKPENVILRDSGAVLIDLDASRVFKSENETDTQVLGTTGFAAPEQYGLGQTDCRADIYSLGVLMNVMLTGKHPTQQLASGHLGRVIQKCTMMSPDRRYQNVCQLMEAL